MDGWMGDWIQVGDLNNFKGNESALTEADLFMFLLVRIPR